MNNNTIIPFGDISFDTIRQYFSLDPSKDEFWKAMLADFQGIYSTIDQETDIYDTVLKTEVRDSCSVNFATLKKDIGQDGLLEDFEKEMFIYDLKIIQDVKIIKRLEYQDVKELIKQEDYDTLFAIFLDLVPVDHRERKFLPYPIKKYKQYNNILVPFVKGSVISSRTTSNQFVLVAAFKLLLYTESRIFKVFIYKK